MFSGKDGTESGSLLPPEPCPCPCCSWDFIDRLFLQLVIASRSDRRQLPSSSMPFRLAAFKGPRESDEILRHWEAQGPSFGSAADSSVPTFVLGLELFRQGAG